MFTGPIHLSTGPNTGQALELSRRCSLDLEGFLKYFEYYLRNFVRFLLNKL